MDIVSLLPIEVSRNIFEYLDVEDLGKCLCVCKHWKNIANDNILWKRHCMIYEVADVLDDNFTDTQSLCHWALVWRKFATSSAFKWYTNQFKPLNLFCCTEYSACSLCGTYLVAYSLRYNNLDVYNITESNKIRLYTSIALCLPKDDAIAAVSMNNDYIIFAKYNIVLVFKKDELNYELNKAYAVVFNTIIHAVRDFSTFVNSNLNLNVISGIIGILDDFLWLSVDFEGTFVINICTNEVINIFTFDSGVLQGNIFSTWSDDEIRIYDKAGNIAASINNLMDLEDVITNETLVAVLRGSMTEEESSIDVWDFDTAVDIFTKKVSCFSWIKLHPKKEILYTLEASTRNNIYQIISYDVRTGETQWVLHQTNSALVSFWELFVVCDKYLVVWPTSRDGNNFFLMDYRTGRVIYEKPRPCCDTNFVTDNIWMSLSNKKKISIRSYL